MRLIKKDNEDAQMGQETIPFAKEQYLYYTKRARVLERILIDRMSPSLNTDILYKEL
jgi:hypothetical protein